MGLIADHIAYDVAIIVLSIFLLVLAIVLFFTCRKKPVQSDIEKDQEEEEDNEEEQQKAVPPVKICGRAYTLMDIDAATDGFNQRRIMAKDLTGTLYAGVLQNGELVAVKRIHPLLVLRNAGLSGFSSVLKCLSSAQHPNIVSIIGFSEAPGERIIVMEFVGTLSLEFYLHQNPDGNSLLDWNQRFKIAAEAARGLHYLHEIASPNIVHGCVKSSNILIDINFSARVSDYGLNFLAPQEKRALVGYVDEEYWISTDNNNNNNGIIRGGGSCKESDVYGFGVVLLELLSGRGCEEGLLVKWALPLIKDMRYSEVLDARLVIPSEIKPLVRLAKVASACVGNSRKCRPSIAQVSTILNHLERETCLMTSQN
ncbi:serine/threonine-protein kinase-like protein ACR4 [Prosopis cineraria]|uniref:serine/threonine-protein kinase-like protein ACR4 n=1 Tax=Prosopis cineraria TaxID=364024 RepID=UPI00240F142E|nr:serine/threonine-protein kinase-like protein ACR4 [Prosopis cineraria]